MSLAAYASETNKHEGDLTHVPWTHVPISLGSLFKKMDVKTGLKYGRAFGISQFTVLFVNFVNFEDINRAPAIFSHWTDVIVIARHVAHV